MSAPDLDPHFEQEDPDPSLSDKTPVHLYVYDLSHGLASQLSPQLLGTHIPAIYHTSLVLSHPAPTSPVEYFYGRGIQTCPPGLSPHGCPLSTMHLGDTEIPPDIIADYLGELAETYHAASYDLWMRNCNNFTDEFAGFLVGRGIPEDIRALPERVLQTPFGAMLRGRIDAGMREVTQAPVVEREGGGRRDAGPGSSLGR